MPTEIEHKIEQHFSHYPLRTYSKGQILIHAGDDPQFIYYLDSGKIRQFDITYRGDEIVVNVFKPGSFFPMLWAITKLENRFFFDVEEEAQVRIVPAAEAVEFLRSNPDVCYDLLRRVYIGANGLLDKITHLMSGSALNRVLYELVIECRRFGVKATDGTYKISINEHDLAIRAGLSRETVSRELTKIRRDQNIIIEHNNIHIINLASLETKLAKTP